MQPTRMTYVGPIETSQRSSVRSLLLIGVRDLTLGLAACYSHLASFHMHTIGRHPQYLLHGWNGAIEKFVPIGLLPIFSGAGSGVSE